MCDRAVWGTGQDEAVNRFCLPPAGDRAVRGVDGDEAVTRFGLPQGAPAGLAPPPAGGQHGTDPEPGRPAEDDRGPARPRAGVSWPRMFLTAAAQRGTGVRAGRWQWIRVACLAAVVALAAVAGVALSGERPGQPGVTAGAVRVLAANWIAGQVSRATVVSCDPVMCATLQASGFPAGNLDVLRPGAPGLLNSEVMAATGVLRARFGSRLASMYAPTVLASFGTGSASIQVRAVAPHGAAAYLRQLSADLATRKSFGAQLARNGGVVAGSAARRQLDRGQVDTRLITVIAAMTRAGRLRIQSFGDASPGAAGVPLRSVLLMPAAGRSPGTGPAGPVSLGSLRSFLDAQQPPYLPAVARIVRLQAGHDALDVQYAAPAPLGLLGTGPSPVTTSSRG